MTHLHFQPLSQSASGSLDDACGNHCLRSLFTREQALLWNPDWSHSDQELLEQNLTRLDAQTFHRRTDWLARFLARRTRGQRLQPDWPLHLW